MVLHLLCTLDACLSPCLTYIHPLPFISFRASPPQSGSYTNSYALTHSQLCFHGVRFGPSSAWRTLGSTYDSSSCSAYCHSQPGCAWWEMLVDGTCALHDAWAWFNNGAFGPDSSVVIACLSAVT
jgi:hypothetical protein